MLRKPFGQLKHFAREGRDGRSQAADRRADVGPLCDLAARDGRAAAAQHDIYITDWRDAKQVPLEDGNFDLDDYVDYLIEFLEVIGERAGGKRPHMLAVCQPAVPALAATALMAADKHPNRPKTLTLMGGPIDTRKAPTAVNTLATQRTHAWFKQNVIATVPYALSGRRAEGLSGLPPARRLHDDEPWQPHGQPLGDVQTSGRRRRRKRRFDARFL